MSSVEGLNTAMEPSPATPSRPFVPLYRFARRCVAGLTAAAIGAAGGVAGSAADAKRAAEPRFYGFEEIYQPDPLPEDTQTAPLPEADAYDWVQHWLNSPVDPHLANLRYEVDRIYNETGGREDIADIENRLLFTIRQETAARFGLTVFDATDTLRTLQSALATTTTY